MTYGRITIGSGDDKGKIRYYRNFPLGTEKSALKRAVIVIHGTARNADDYYDRMLSAIQTQDLQESTLLLAPNFITSAETPISDHNELYWSKQGWKVGENAENENRASSFTVLDTILEKIDRNFPNIDLVTIAGHSAGAQFVQRYAALNQKDGDASLGFHIRYVAANPSSYMYLTNTRPLPTTDCADFDNYKYGMADLPGSLSYTNLTKTEISNQLIGRSVCILLGTADTEDNYSRDNTCQAQAQGPNRYQRGLSYYDHVKSVSQDAKHIKIEVPDIGHSSSRMFNSDEGMNAILSDIVVAGGGEGSRIPGSGSEGNVEVTAQVTAIGNVESIKVWLDLDHTYTKDLAIILKSPSGKEVTLSYREGGTGDNYRNTTFSDGARNSIVGAAAPFTGIYKPKETLSAFANESATGTWTLKIQDKQSQDTGTLKGWQLFINTR